MKARGVYETPGGTLLRRARRAVETVTLDREVIQLRDSLMPRYAQLVYNGFWFAPERVLLQKLVDEASTPVTGTARLKLYKGNCIVAGRKSPRSLYRPDFATFEAEQVYDQKDAGGFIKLNALRLRIAQMRASRSSVGRRRRRLGRSRLGGRRLHRYHLRLRIRTRSQAQRRSSDEQNRSHWCSSSLHDGNTAAVSKLT